ncbi:MAG: hypothetical protein QT03_C0001G0205 [archaeon GW2011_AR10]|uniref:Uncharacterized protein n=1 Tax=Candidatus Iainarchaeum sp. TaxID=3101447 RepID=A0A7J4IYY8_9ARCH|nr:MAG: hypothetical protein QT03_C0001G0205 [archaeon GW2011_AR10]HIH08997.1 hypothetical protein [Candidatus Diapherotrites archaeon]
MALGDRAAQFQNLRRYAMNRLRQEYQLEENPTRRNLIMGMVKSIAFTPVKVYPDADVLREGIKKEGNIYSAFQIKGQNIVQFFERIIGNKKQVKVENLIEVPDLWKGNKFDPEKVAALFHEYGHSVKLFVDLPRTTEMHEERLADTLSVYTCKKIGLPAEAIARSLQGRAAIVGRDFQQRLIEEAFGGEAKRAAAVRKAIRRKIEKERRKAAIGKVVPFRPPVQRQIIRRGPRGRIISIPRIMARRAA